MAERKFTAGAAMVTALLHNGKENAISRLELAQTLGIPDRRLRSYIEDARNAGVIICNDQDSKGYYIAATVEEAEEQYWQEKARALAILKLITPLRRMLVQAGRNVKDPKKS